MNTETTFARRGQLGFLRTSTFLARQYPQAIWVGEQPIVGPFCQHCGNPFYVHGPNGECLNYRIHPVLPLGDLPRTKEFLKAQEETREAQRRRLFPFLSQDM